MREKLSNTARKNLIKMQKEVLTIEEAAKLLQLSKRSLYKLVRKGTIPGKKVLNKWRFERESLKRWLAKGKENEFNQR